VVLADEIIERMLKEVEPYTSTKKIYRLARKYLKKFNHASVLRYSLKRALFRLGPSGYPFEKYYSAVLKNYGYETETGIILQGKCIRHEVDVVAVKKEEVALVECKYRSRAGIPVDVKVAMYVHSRFLDLAPVMAEKYPGKKFKGWLVTNTRCTSDAIEFAGCYGLNIKTWKHPSADSLETMIEGKRLYPVTIISGIQKGLIDRLISKNIILLKDLVSMERVDIQKMVSLPERKAERLKHQAEELCLC
jgi:Holliday junction resolvase